MKTLINLAVTQLLLEAQMFGVCPPLTQVSRINSAWSIISKKTKLVERLKHLDILDTAKEAWNVKMEFVLEQHQLLLLQRLLQQQQLYHASPLLQNVGMALMAAWLVKEDVAVDQIVMYLDCLLMITFAHEELMNIDIAFAFYIIFCFSL